MKTKRKLKPKEYAILYSIQDLRTAHIMAESHEDAYRKLVSSNVMVLAAAISDGKKVVSYP